MTLAHRAFIARQILLAVFLLAGGPFSSLNQEKQTPESSHITAILALDNSGSMKASDPTGLRFTAVEMIAALLAPDDQLGVMAFSTVPQLLTKGLVSPQTFPGLPPIAPEGYTDIHAALVEARNMLSDADPRNRKGLILLSDGKPEIEHPYLQYEQETLDLALSLGIPIYAIALTNSADLGFLHQLTAETGGLLIPANDAGDLLDAYLSAFSAIQDRTLLGQGESVSPGNATLEIDPALAPYLEKVSFVLAKPESVSAQLLTPDGQPVVESPSTVQVTENARFLVVTLQHPPGGQWRFTLAGHGQAQARTILYSRLRVKIVAPLGIQKMGAPMPVIARLVEQKDIGQFVTIIGEAAFSAVITSPDGAQSSLDQFYDDGTHGDKTAGDGNFTRLFTNTAQAGQYPIQLTGWKGVVPVGQSASVEVVAFPALVLDAPRGAYQINDQPVPLRAHLEGGNPAMLDRGQVLAHITAPSGKVDEVVLSGVQGAYTGEFHPIENGDYTVLIETWNALYLGAPFWDVTQGEFNVHILRAIQMGKPQAQVLAGCFNGVERVRVRMPVASTRTETVSVLLDGPPGFVLQPAVATLASGDGMLALELLPSAGSLAALPAGTYRASLRITGDPEASITPENLPIEILIPSPWARCRQPITWGGLISLLACLTGIVVMHRVRHVSAPPLVTGTLRWWVDGNSSAQAHECDLTALGKSTLSLGAKNDCDVVVAAGNLDDRHAIFVAEKDETGVPVYLEPLGVVKKGYQPARVRFLLRHGETFNSGGLNFQYLSDSGE